MCCVVTKTPKAHPGSDGAVMSEEAEWGDMTDCSISHLVTHGNGHKRSQRQRREVSYGREIRTPKA